LILLAVFLLFDALKKERVSSTEWWLDSQKVKGCLKRCRWRRQATTRALPGLACLACLWIRTAIVAGEIGKRHVVQ
jgi:hypothetical protein